MDGDTMALDEHGVYHGYLFGDCGWPAEATFACANCERTICYCGGHDLHDSPDGKGTIDCGLCDECCTLGLDKPADRPGGRDA